MSNSLRSILLGTALLDVMLVIALGLTVLRLPSPRPDTTARDRVISLFLIGIAAQSVHFMEEFITGFYLRWPEFLGSSPWSAEFFMSFNTG